ncbi:TRAF-type zinc finger domain-containing protein 1 isoform X2 [Microcaecilia unicolor]|uniref:TRAF-type zinc finger domain-containing protein 1 n=1 Tax=Microcaecilia unicolor TaxID=1415580 RepID=A0A6P7Z2K6_9AMPH|nr:TRAF-type zinc finger domain-containing protein 1 isoform X2 [Microcaecilia unicolor]
MATAPEKETQLCGNCKKDIPMANFTIHEIHCRRNIMVCQTCMEPVPKSEMDDHIEFEHAQITCKCGMKLERSQLEKHETLECCLRLVNCQYCELELVFNKVEEHEDYCGARTEVCNGCGRNVMVKDSKAHPEICGKDEDKKNNRYRPQPPNNYVTVNDDGAWFESQALQNFPSREHYGQHLPRIPGQLASWFYTSFGLDETLERANRRSQIMHVDQKQEKQKLERNINFDSSVHGEDNSNLDYLLALSLQNEHNPSKAADAEGKADFWRAFYSKDLTPSQHLLSPAKTDILSHDSSAPIISDEPKPDDIMLPCEFCEELFPEEDLILHQTGCNPDSVLPAFRRRSSPGQPQEHAEHFPTLLEQMSSPGFMSRELASLLEGPPALEPEGSIIIPCEFCGIQLEEEILYHHQDQCDLRPSTAGPAERTVPNQQWPPENDNVDKTESPEIHRRQIRHQGDISTHHLNDVLQRRVNRASQPPTQSTLAVTRNVWQKPPNAAGDGNIPSLERFGQKS